MAELWFDDDRRDLFLVPEEVSLAQGDRWLRTFDGRVRGWDPEALEPYRVDAEAARPYVRAWIEGGYARAREALARGYGDEPPVPPSLEAAIGVDPARLGDPEALVEAARHVGRGVARWLDRDAPPEVAASVRQATSALAEIVGALARSVGEE